MKSSYPQLCAVSKLNHLQACNQNKQVLVYIMISGKETCLQSVKKMTFPLFKSVTNSKQVIKAKKVISCYFLGYKFLN